MNNSETNIKYVCPKDGSALVPWIITLPTVEQATVDKLAKQVESTELPIKEADTKMYKCTSTGTIHRFKLIINANDQPEWEEQTTQKIYPAS